MGAIARAAFGVKDLARNTKIRGHTYFTKTKSVAAEAAIIDICIEVSISNYPDVKAQVIGL